MDFRAVSGASLIASTIPKGECGSNQMALMVLLGMILSKVKPMKL